MENKTLQKSCIQPNLIIFLHTLTHGCVPLGGNREVDATSGQKESRSFDISKTHGLVFSWLSDLLSTIELEWIGNQVASCQVGVGDLVGWKTEITTIK